MTTPAAVDTTCAAGPLCETGRPIREGDTVVPIRDGPAGQYMHPVCHDRWHPAAHAWANREERT